MARRTLKQADAEIAELKAQLADAGKKERATRLVTVAQKNVKATQFYFTKATLDKMAKLADERGGHIAVVPMKDGFKKDRINYCVRVAK